MKISQREARRLRRRVNELEDAERTRRNAYVSTYPGGVHLVTYTFDKDFYRGQTEAAQKIGCALVAKLQDAQLRIYAVK